MKPPAEESAHSGRACHSPRREKVPFSSLVFGGMLSALALSGCVGPGAHERGGAKVGVLSVRDVDWNPSHVETGHASFVAEMGEDTLLLSGQGAFFFVGGALVGSDRRNADWRGAAAIPAADGQGTWLVGLDGSGVIHRVRARTSMEPISERYGLATRRIRGVASLGQGLTGFSVDSPPLQMGPTDLPTGNFAVAGGGRVSAFDLPLFHVFAGANGKAAWVEPQGVRVLEPAPRESHFYALPGANNATLDAHGRLFATTDSEVYAEDERGHLALVYETSTEQASITGLVASGDRVWFSEGANLGVVDGARAAVTTSLARPGASQIMASPSGDVWSLYDGALSRFAVEQIRYPAAEEATPKMPVSPDSGGSSVNQPDRWKAEIAPIFARACASCHGPTSSSGIDLSTSEAWQSRLPALRRRVILERDMPPRGRPFSEPDRRAVEQWTAPSPR